MLKTNSLQRKICEILQGTKGTILPNTLPCREVFIIDCLSALQKCFELVSWNHCYIINPLRKLQKYWWLSYTVNEGSNFNNRHFVFINITFCLNIQGDYVLACRDRFLKINLFVYICRTHVLPSILMDFGNIKLNRTRPFLRIFLNK